MEGTPKNPLSTKIGIKLVIPYLIASFLTLIFIAGLAYYNYKVQLEAINTIQDEISLRINTDISLFLTNVTKKIQLVGKNSSLQVNSQTRDKVLVNLLQEEPTILAVSYVNKEGKETNKLLRYVAQQEQLFDISKEKKFQQALAGKIYISPVYFSQYNMPSVTISVPVIDEDGNKSGVLIAEVDLTPLWDDLIHTKVKKTGYVYVVDGKGTLLIYKDIELVKKHVVITDSLVIKNFIGQIPTREFYKSFTGEKVIGKWQAINNTDWGVIVELPLSEVYQESIPLIIVGAVGSVILSLVAITSFLYLMYLLVLLPLGSLYRGVLEIQKGNLDIQVRVFRRDEIGKLSDTFNQMVMNLKKNIQEVNEEKSKLSASISSLSVGFIMTDLENHIIVINQTAKNILCMADSKEASTQLPCALSDIEERLKTSIDLKDLIGRCITEKKPFFVQELAIEARFLKIFITPVIESSDVLGVVILVDDITEAKVLERSKDEFFSIASHELRTPLTAIKGNTSMIQQFYADKINDSELKEMMSDIYDSSSRLIGIVNDFLDMSRLEQGKMAFKKQVFDIVELIHTTLRQYQVTGSQRNLSLEYKGGEAQLPKVYGDPDKVKQALINLIGNGLKFTKEGGVNVTAKLLLSEEGIGYVKVYVSDTGYGIPPENRNLLFRKFQQAGSSLLTHDTTKGTGLGLYISKLIIEGMGGQIKLEGSAEGKGTTFSFTIPVASQEQISDEGKSKI